MVVLGDAEWSNAFALVRPSTVCGRLLVRIMFAYGKMAKDGIATTETKSRMPAPVSAVELAPAPRQSGRPSSLLDTRVVYCGDNLEQLAKLPDGCVDLIYIDPPFNSNRNYEVFWGETKEKRTFEARHANN